MRSSTAGGAGSPGCACQRFERAEVIVRVDLELDADRADVTDRQFAPRAVGGRRGRDGARERIAQAAHAGREAFLSKGARGGCADGRCVRRRAWPPRPRRSPAAACASA